MLRKTNFVLTTDGVRIIIFDLICYAFMCLFMYAYIDLMTLFKIIPKFYFVDFVFFLTSYVCKLTQPNSKSLLALQIIL